MIGKRHDNLLRDIAKYLKILDNSDALKVEGVKFFVESSYFDSKGEPRPCYLLTKMGCEMVANKLTGEKGILFTALYVAKFNEMEAAERAEMESQLARAATPHLKVFNTAVRNVLNGYANTCASYEEIMDFLRGAYKPFGIDVIRESGKHCLTATDIAAMCGILSETGRPHALAAAAIIGKLDIAHEHMAVIPYGMVGISMRYDVYVLDEVRRFITDNDLPRHIPHLDFEYHIYYNPDCLFLYDSGSYNANSGNKYFDAD